MFVCSGQSALPWLSETAGQSERQFPKWKARQGSSVRLCIPHRACHSRWHCLADGFPALPARSLGVGCRGCLAVLCFSVEASDGGNCIKRQHQRQRHAGPALKTSSVRGAVDAVLSELLKLSRSAWPARKIDGWAAFHAPRTAQEGRRQLGRVGSGSGTARPGGTREAQEQQRNTSPGAITARPSVADDAVHFCMHSVLCVPTTRASRHLAASGGAMRAMRRLAAGR